MRSNKNQVPPIHLDFEFGTIILNKSGKPAESGLTYGGVPCTFPQAPTADELVFDASLPDSIASDLLRVLLKRVSTHLVVSREVPLELGVSEDVEYRVTDDSTYRKVIHAAAARLLAEINETKLREEVEQVVDLEQDVLHGDPGRLHTARHNTEKRKPYAGELAPLGGTGVQVFLHHYGYVKGTSYEGVNGDGEERTGTKWVRPRYRAVDELTEQLALQEDVPATLSADRALPVVQLRWKGPFESEKESGYLFCEGVEIVTESGTVLGELNEPVSPRYIRNLGIHPPDVIESMDSEIRRIFPTPREVQFATPHSSITDCYRADFSGEHRFSADPFFSYPHLGTSRQGRYGDYWVYSDFDGDGYERMLKEFRSMDAPEPAQPWLESVREIEEAVREKVLKPGERFARRSARLDNALIVLRNAVDLLNDLGPEDAQLTAIPRSTGRIPLDPSLLATRPVTWHDHPSGDEGQHAYLTFALTQTDAYYVGEGVVRELSHSEEKIELPRAWGYKGNTFRFAQVHFVRHGTSGEVELALIMHVCGYDEKRGCMVDVPVPGSFLREPLLRAALDHLGIEAVDMDLLQTRYDEADVHMTTSNPEISDDSHWMRAVSNAVRLNPNQSRPRDLEAERKALMEDYPHLKSQSSWGYHLRHSFNLVQGPHFSIKDEIFKETWRRGMALTLPMGLPWHVDPTTIHLESAGRTLLYVSEGVPVDADTQRHAGIWVYRDEDVIALEHGQIDVSHGLVIRMESRKEGEVDIFRSVRSMSGGGSASPVPATVPFEEIGKGLLEQVFKRPKPLYRDRGEFISRATAIRQATLLEAVEAAGGKHLPATRLLIEWGLPSITASTLSTHLGHARNANLDRIHPVPERT